MDHESINGLCNSAYAARKSRLWHWSVHARFSLIESPGTADSLQHLTCLFQSVETS
jgi:hypothetical protein